MPELSPRIGRCWQVVMSYFYCRDCMSGIGFNPVAPSTLLLHPWNGSTGYPSKYQQGKIEKHSNPADRSRKNGVFSLSGNESQFGYLNTALVKGILEFDPQGRKNLIYPVGSTIGVQYEHGMSTMYTNAVLVAFPQNSTLAHPFPVFLGPGLRVCAKCGRLLTD